MAGVRDKELVSTASWAGGVKNVGPETSQFEATRVSPAYLRAAINVDLDDDGKLRACAGHTLIREAQDMRGLWKHDSWPFALFAEGGDLCALYADETVEVLVSGISQNVPSFALCVDYVYWTDGVSIGRIDDLGNTYPLGCEQPAGQPLVSAIEDGGMPAGTYQVAITYTDVYGIESGSTLAVEIDLTEGQGLMLDSIPQPAGGEVDFVNVFVTRPNGTELYFRRTLSLGILQWPIGNSPEGRALETQLLTPIPPGQYIAYFSGHLLVAAGDTLFRSAPLRYGLTSLRGAYTKYGGRINALLPVGDANEGAGAYVAAGGRTYWHAGADPRAWQRVIAYASDAVPNTGLLVPENVFNEDGSQTQFAAYWLAADGQFCLGRPNGNVELLAERVFLADPATSGASVLRSINGLRTVMTVADRTTTNKSKFVDEMSSFVYRNGIAVGE